MSFFVPTRTSNITDIIKFGNSLDISHSKFHQKTSFVDDNANKIIMNYNSFINTYYDLMLKNTQVMTLNDQEYNMYRFQPKRLSLELYDTTELWSCLMMVNHITSITEFDLKEPIVFEQDTIFDILNEILILEDSNIKKNKEEIYGK